MAAKGIGAGLRWQAVYTEPVSSRLLHIMDFAPEDSRAVSAPHRLQGGAPADASRMDSQLRPALERWRPDIEARIERIR